MATTLTESWFPPPPGDEPTTSLEADPEAAWPEPLRLASELPAVLPFSSSLLPSAFKRLATDIAERMQVPIDYPAIVEVLGLAGAVSRRATMQPKGNDSSWRVTPNLWGGIVAPPGFMKSPVIQAATRPLCQIQALWRNEYESARGEYRKDEEKRELRRAAWRDQYKGAIKRGDAEPSEPDDSVSAPTMKRLILNDSTFEATHLTMKENPAGILVIRDELTGWWSQLDRAGREGERAFCLSAWNGDTPHTIDRIGRGSVHVEHCCMSFLGGIQPARLRSYLSEAIADGPANDGLIQRFQLLVWPDTSADCEYIDRSPDPAAEQLAGLVYRKLLALEPEDPLRLRFAPDAQELFRDWLTELEGKIRGKDLHPALCSHLSKYRSLMPSLALLFELCDWAVGDGAHGETVSLVHAQQAAGWCDYLESHARRLYSCIVTPQLRAARELAGKIAARKVGAEGFFTARDVYLCGWAGLDTPEKVKAGCEVLEDAVWLRSATVEPGRQGGRPSTRYVVNPGVYR